MGMLVSNCGSPCICGQTEGCQIADSSQGSPGGTYIADGHILWTCTAQTNGPVYALAGCCQYWWYLECGSSGDFYFTIFGDAYTEYPASWTYTLTYNGSTVVSLSGSGNYLGGYSYWFRIPEVAGVLVRSSDGLLLEYIATGYSGTGKVVQTLDIAVGGGGTTGPGGTIPLFPFVRFFNCVACHAVGNTGGGGNGSNYQQWWWTGQPTQTLVQPGKCAPVLGFSQMDQGQAEGQPMNHPGLLVENRFYYHNFDPFDWTCIFVYDGATILTESGHFPGGSTIPYGWAFLPFSNPGWYGGGGGWNWDYTGPASANMQPVVTVTFTMFNTIDNLNDYPGGLPVWSYQTQ
jgi:hypothetical protein